MKRVKFNYKRADETFNALVDGVLELAMLKADESAMDFNAKENYAARLLEINQGIMKYACEGTRYEKDSQDLNLAKNPQFTRNSQIRDNFNAVIAQVITAVAPEVASAQYSSALADVVQIGYGETARFPVHSNELFVVNQVAEGVRRGVLQPVYNNEYTVNCGPIEIATSIDWYAVAAGVFDWGDFSLKAGRSFEGYIFLKVVAAMTSAASLIGSGYTATGMSTTNWTTLAARVKAANGNQGSIYALGTLPALNQVIPSTVGLQYGLGEEVAKKGFLSEYLAVKLLPVDQVLVPGTTNTTADFAVPDTKIYFISADSYRPVKVVFEGNSVTVETDTVNTSDKSYGISIQMRIGVSAIVGTKFGVLTLS